MTIQNNNTADNDDATRAQVQQHYGAVAASRGQQGCCGGAPANPLGEHDAQAYSARIGYSADELAATPEDANLGLGCGNPVALAALSEGEVVIDLGSGGGFDAILSAKRVGPTGRVIGIDMTGEMLGLARKNAVTAGVEGFTEFREGVISNLPVVDDRADVVMSNCVINLSPDKGAVLSEAFRVLKPGGRFAVSDIMITEPLPEAIQKAAEAYFGCVAGAMLADDFFQLLGEVGFVDVQSTRRSATGVLVPDDEPLLKAAIATLGVDKATAVAKTIWSYTIEARKPA